RLQVALVGRLADHRAAGHIADRLAQHAPLLGAARLALPRAEDTHVRRVVNRGLHAQDRALLVIHLDGIAIEPMLDADAFRPLSQVRGDLALKATVNPAL